MVAFDGAVTSFARLQRRMQLRDAAEARASGVAVSSYVFDLLHLAGRSTRELSLRDRKRLLRDVVPFDDPVGFTPHRNEHGTAYLADACDRGWEGLIAKVGSGYDRPTLDRVGDLLDARVRQTSPFDDRTRTTSSANARRDLVHAGATRFLNGRRPGGPPSACTGERISLG